MDKTNTGGLTLYPMPSEYLRYTHSENLTWQPFLLGVTNSFIFGPPVYLIEDVVEGWEVRDFDTEEIIELPARLYAGWYWLSPKEDIE